jgi:hypothetical protein
MTHKGTEIMIIRPVNATEVCGIANASENKNLILK